MTFNIKFSYDTMVDYNYLWSLQVLPLCTVIADPHRVVPSSGRHSSLLAGAPATEPLATRPAMMLGVLHSKFLLTLVATLEFSICNPVHWSCWLHNDPARVVYSTGHHSHCRLNHLANIASCNLGLDRLPSHWSCSLLLLRAIFPSFLPLVPTMVPLVAGGAHSDRYVAPPPPGNRHHLGGALLTEPPSTWSTVVFRFCGSKLSVALPTHLHP